MSDPLTSLVKKIDQTINAAAGKYPGGQKLGTYFIIGDAKGRADQLRGMAKKESLQHVSLCIGVVPPRYEVNNEPEATGVIYNPRRPNHQPAPPNFPLPT